MQAPNFTDVLAAQKRIRPYLAPTPCYSYPAVNSLIGTNVYVKHENAQPVGAFKVRGGINLMSQLSEEEKARGVVTASTGNHGQSIAYTARLFGIKAYIVVPTQAPAVKVNAIRSMGAEIIVHGEKFDDSRLHTELLGREKGYRYIHSGNEPHLIAGVATHTLEMLEAQPEIDTVIVLLGGGSGAAGACIAAHAINANIRVIAVQSEKAPSGYNSWKQREVEKSQHRTRLRVSNAHSGQF